ncbi:PfkB family carbohydrate kinase [Dactylosporangium sp. NPDC049140]|uniref:carbohydrate kinase family protein n=1 Tax=Dactylosporangium sp. NPDC049140 TaxID=3155647 RepID=UPI0033CED0A2
MIGDANPDLVLRGDVRPRFGQEEQLLDAADLVLGGSAAITATGCARLGLRTGLLAAVGADVFGAFTRERLTERDVELLTPARDTPKASAPHAQENSTSGTGATSAAGTGATSAAGGGATSAADAGGSVGATGADAVGVTGAGATPTGLSIILSAPGDRAILTLPGTIPTLRPEDVTDELLASARHVHVASLFLQPGLHAGLAGAFARARALGVTTSLDTNWDPSGRWSGLEEILAVTDVFLPNAAELLAVTGAGALEEAAEKLVGSGTTVVLKDGARGGRAWWPGGGYVTAPGLAVDVVDTTGAGDSFNAGFLAARLAGRDVPEALAWAARAGSLSTRAAGGTAAQATVDDLAAGAH